MQEYFRAIYYDDDSRIFNISEIISDDTYVIDRTVRMQREGRNVNISFTEPVNNPCEVPSVESIRDQVKEGYQYNPHLKW